MGEAWASRCRRRRRRRGSLGETISPVLLLERQEFLATAPAAHAAAAGVAGLVLAGLFRVRAGATSAGRARLADGAAATHHLRSIWRGGGDGSPVRTGSWRAPCAST